MLQIAPDMGGKRVASAPIIVGIAVLVAIGLALVWRYTPLADVVTPKSVIALAGSLADYWWAPLALIVSYTPATLVMFPRWLITLAAVAIFGPWAAFAYAQLGVVLAALCGYVIGKLVSRETVRQIAGPRIHRLTRLLRRRGLIAVTLVRLVAIAPFIVVNVVMGATRIRLHHYIIGTVLGMLPGCWRQPSWAISLPRRSPNRHAPTSGSVRLSCSRSRQSHSRPRCSLLNRRHVSPRMLPRILSRSVPRVCHLGRAVSDYYRGEASDGVADGTRTHDDRNHNPGLYQLSYSHRRTTIIVTAKPRRLKPSHGASAWAKGSPRLEACRRYQIANPLKG